MDNTPNNQNFSYEPAPQQNFEQNYASGQSTPPAYGEPVQNNWAYAAPPMPPAPKRRRRRYRATEVALLSISLVIVCALLMILFTIASVGGALSSLVVPVLRDISPPSNSFSIIRVEGAIQSTTTDSLGMTTGYDHTATLEYVKQLTEDEGNKGILLYMNTGGGGVFESDELYRALEAYKEKTGRPVWAYMHQTCASGGYYISMAAEKLYANYGCVTGSIGVYIAFSDTSGLYEKLGVETVLIRSGKNKGTGVTGAPISEDQRAVYQSLVDEDYERFVQLVSGGRSISIDRAKELADGRPYSANQALELGLVDELSDWDAAQKAFEEKTGATAFTPSFSNRASLGSVLGELTEAAPKSDLEQALTLTEEVQNGVPMAWGPGLYS